MEAAAETKQIVLKETHTKYAKVSKRGVRAHEQGSPRS
jgi:hypothetical protein